MALSPDQVWPSAALDVRFEALFLPLHTLAKVLSNHHPSLAHKSSSDLFLHVRGSVEVVSRQESRLLRISCGRTSVSTQEEGLAVEVA